MRLRTPAGTMALVAGDAWKCLRLPGGCLLLYSSSGHWLEIFHFSCRGDCRRICNRCWGSIGLLLAHWYDMVRLERLILFQDLGVGAMLYIFHFSPETLKGTHPSFEIELGTFTSSSFRFSRTIHSFGCATQITFHFITLLNPIDSSILDTH
jgi:hypothetical protein